MTEKLNFYNFYFYNYLLVLLRVCGWIGYNSGRGNMARGDGGDNEPLILQVTEVGKIDFFLGFF